jgi:flavodoxin I
MSKVIVIYGSTTGNTEEMAHVIAKTISGTGVDVVLKNVTDASPAELTGYDFIILGSSTWGDGELQDDFIVFEEEMNEVNLNGKQAAVFGCGESSWPMFCEAVNIIEKKLKECEAELISESFKIDGSIAPELENLSKWALTIIR